MPKVAKAAAAAAAGSGAADMAGTGHRRRAILAGLGLLLALAVPLASHARDATTNLQIPRVTTPQVVPHKTPPGGVRDPTIPPHRLKVITPGTERKSRGCGPGVTRNAPKGGPGVFALPDCGRKVKGPRPNDPPGCTRISEVRVCP